MNPSNKASSKQNRREFLLSILKASGQVMVAQAALYSVSLVDGSFKAGAKDCFGERSNRTFPPDTVVSICETMQEGAGPTDLNDTVTCLPTGQWGSPGSSRPSSNIGWCD